jgi:hypothetical protein
MILFTVDRNNAYSSGYQLTNERFTDIHPDVLQAHVDTLFPNGLTKHGERHFLRDTNKHGVIEAEIELLFEYVRRGSFGSKPSRFQSVFATDSLDQAKAFRQRYGGGHESIWMLNGEPVFKADMSLLRRGATTLVSSWLAHEYWKGHASSDPFWEYLLLPPVTIAERVIE